MDEEHEIVYTKSRHSLDSLHENANTNINGTHHSYPDHEENDDMNMNRNEEQDIVHPLPQNPRIQQFEDDACDHEHEHDYHLTASIAS